MDSLIREWSADETVRQIKSFDWDSIGDDDSSIGCILCLNNNNNNNNSVMRADVLRIHYVEHFATLIKRRYKLRRLKQCPVCLKPVKRLRHLVCHMGLTHR